MVDQQMPTPRTTTDRYLAAIHDQLGELLARLSAPPAGEVGPVELREPAARVPVGGRGDGSPEPPGGESGPGAPPRRRPARPSGAKTTTRKRTPKKEG